jgi:transposase
MPKMTAPANTSRVVSEVFGGVDTHADTHTVAALDQVGGLLGHAVFPASRHGYQQLLDWLGSHGPLVRVGVEGTGSYGAGLAGHLMEAGIVVVEVNRANRADRRHRGKSDPVDAENAARAVLAGTASAQPKTHTGVVEAIRAVHIARKGAVKARTSAINQFRAVLITAPTQLREHLTSLTLTQQVLLASHYRPGPVTDPTSGVKISLRRLARRISYLTDEIKTADTDLKHLTHTAASHLLAEPGVGPDTAAQLLITTGDNPERLTSEASFAALCGVSPIPASSGKTTRHRLNRGGDRQANRALHTIALSRMRYDQRTKTYVAKARTEGKTTKEILRQLKRYLARHLYKIITQPDPRLTP